MSCRCRDIRNCSHDIEIINEILSNLENVKSIQDNVSNEYTELARISQITFITNNMNQLNEAQSKLNETVVEEVPKLISQCDEKIEELHRKLSSMKTEDKHYHSHHHHHD